MHVHHGIGRFVGIQRMPVDGVEKDYIKIDYAGGDCLYVPVTQLDLVSKYIGGGERIRSGPGSTSWAAPSGPSRKPRPRRPPRTWPRASSPCTPSGSAGPALPSPRTPPGRREFEEAFPYAETDDQLQCHRGDQEGYGAAPAHGPPALRRRGLRQDGGGPPGGDEVRPGRQAGRHFGAHHRSGPAALRHRLQPVPRISR